MCSSLTNKFFFVFVLLALNPFVGVKGQRIMESGIPPIYNYTSKEYKAMSQNWQIIQDKRGIIYIANNGGVLEFDGENWRIIELDKKSSARALAIDSSGMIYVGGNNEIGFLTPDTTGLLQYHSLNKYLPEEIKDFGAIWKVYASPMGVYFQATRHIFLWNGKKITEWHAEHDFHVSFLIHDELIIKQRTFGFCKPIKDYIAGLKNGSVVGGANVYSVEPFDNDEFLLFTEHKGIYKVQISNDNQLGVLKRFPTEIDSFFYHVDLNCALRLSNGNYAIGTKGNGLLIIDKMGKLVSLLSTQKGLQDNIIYSLFEDKFQNLWLACSNGITRIEYNSPITKYNEKLGLESTVESITRYKGDLFMATQTGLFQLKQNSINNKHNIDALQYEMRQIKSVTMEAWNVCTFYNGNQENLLLALDLGIYLYNDNGSISKLLECYPWTLKQSTSDSNRVWVGLDDGLQAMYNKGDSWIIEDRIPGIEADIRHIQEDKDGNLWLGSTKDIYRVEIITDNQKLISSSNVTVYDSTAGLPNNVYKFRHLGTTNITGTGVGLFNFNSEKSFFSPSNLLGKEFSDGSIGIHRISEDQNGNLWMVVYQIENDKKISIGFTQKQPDGNLVFNSTPFLEISEDIIHTLYHDSNGITWLGGPSGLFRYNTNIFKNYLTQYNTYIRTVTLGRDSILFAGSYLNAKHNSCLKQPINLIPNIAYTKQAITFEFAAPTFGEKSSNLYSWKLEGYENNWSEWKDKLETSYNNLYEGSYTFMVKAKNTFNSESSTVAFSFTVIRPWYRSLWAYAFYLLFFVAFVMGAIRISTRGLQKIIRERTAEVVKQKEVIEEKNNDIMDSIHYAQRIQRAILPPDELMAEALPEHFVLYRPKDIVSGDFYWMESVKDRKPKVLSIANPTINNQNSQLVLFAVVDCTGHGVPGAFVSIIGNNSLNQAMHEYKLTHPAEILDRLNKSVAETLRQRDEANTVRDGMDLALCALNTTTNVLEFAGANNPLWIVRNNKSEKSFKSDSVKLNMSGEQWSLYEIKPDKQPIGHYSDNPKSFTNHTVQLEKGDVIYIFSDGFADQFGGEKGKKYKYKPFKKLLLTIQETSIKNQKDLIEKDFVDWMRDLEQIDDVCVIGVKI